LPCSEVSEGEHGDPIAGRVSGQSGLQEDASVEEDPASAGVDALAPSTGGEALGPSTDVPPSPAVPDGLAAVLPPHPR
jgi:hypothetical protein